MNFRNSAMSRYFRDRNIIPRVRRFVEENRSDNGYVDVDLMVEGLQQLYPDYRRQKKLLLKKNVQEAYEEVRRMLSKDDSPDEDDVAEAIIDEIPTPKKNLVNERLRNLYASNNSPARDSKLEDIMVIDVVGDHPDTQSPISSAKTKKPLKRKKVMSSEERDQTSMKNSRTPTFQSVISTAKISDMVLDEKIVEEVELLILQNLRPELCRQLGINSSCGFMLHGPSGCGKTFLVDAIAGELGISLFKVPATELVSGVSGESEGTIRSLFEQARSSSPCIVFIDEIDTIAPKRESAHREMERRIVSQLISSMDDLKNDTTGVQVLVIGATNRIDAIDAALRNRFHKEIALNIPDRAAREKILRLVCGKLRLAPDFCQESWYHLAVNTPGYVGGDIRALAIEASTIAMKRALDQIKADRLMKQTTDAMETDSCAAAGSNTWSWLLTQAIDLPSLHITSEDFNMAMKRVQPSALREGFATVPNVTWDQVGALSDIRSELKMSILMPIRYSDAFESLGGMVANGILMYGPPGCGKTLLAKAIANEAGINFISVKGPELLNMYLGESERGVRRVFQRARNSVPCIIFFDEFDALCPRRSGHGDAGATDRIVNQLLSEMDGVEASRRGVYLMAATNRHDMIDPAVMRPGRFDKIIYVGFPKPEDRADILRALTKNGTKLKLAEDVDLEAIGLDRRLDGYTGADLSSLVLNSFRYAFKEAILNRENHPSQSNGNSGDKDIDVLVHRRHFDTAVSISKPSVSKKDREYFERRQAELNNESVALPLQAV